MPGSSTNLLFVWHFHQPYFSHPDRTSNTLPWVRLRAISSYYDTGRMLENHPEIRCVVHFSGALLEQLREYLEVGKRDTWWHLTEKPASSLSEVERRHLLRHFFRLSWDTSVRPIPRYRGLLEKRGEDPEQLDPASFSDQELRDLQVLFNLAWFGWSAREERSVVRTLLEKGEQFSEAEKGAVLEQQMEVMQLLLPLYRRLHRRDQVEIGITPMYHPIVPLLIDTETAARPGSERPRPDRFRAPEDAETQLRRARTVVRDVLGVDAGGVWPPGGAVSPETVVLFEETAFDWCASDEEILRRSRGRRWDRSADLYRPWRLREGGTTMLFGDRTLSDQIEFVYGDAPVDRAVDDFLERCEAVERSGGERPVVTVALGGESPWGRYRHGGRYFLDELYGRVAVSEAVETTTPSRLEAAPARLETLHSGSRLHGDFRTWIGGETTNRAWESLRSARATVVDRVDEVELTESERRKTWKALYMAEGSDWYRWYGENFSSADSADFDRLFREQLRYVYRMLGETPPGRLDSAIAPDRTPRIPFAAPRTLIKPKIDGRSDDYYEWSGSGIYRPGGGPASMFETVRFVEEIRVGYDLDYLYVRVDPSPDVLSEWVGVDLRLQIEAGERKWEARVPGDEREGRLERANSSRSLPLELVGVRESLEVGIPFELLGVGPGDPLELIVAILGVRAERERHPPQGTLAIEVPDESFDLVNWRS